MNESNDWFLDNSKIHQSECEPLSMGRWMSQVFPVNTKSNAGLIYQNGNLDLASFDKNGNAYAEPVFPFELEFVPNRNVLKWTNSNSRWYK